MSRVTNVLVHVGTLERGALVRLTEAQPWNAGQALNDLKAGFQSWGGAKHPDWLVYGAAFNYLDWDAFATWLVGLPWDYPDEVMVLTKGQEENRPAVWVVEAGELHRKVAGLRE